MRYNENWDEVSPGIFTLNERGMKELADYLEVHGERIRREHREMFDKLWQNYLSNEAEIG